jgi:Uma2 family endonuclease
MNTTVVNDSQSAEDKGLSRSCLAETDLMYPCSDGQPMADNTVQYRWIVTIKENLEYLYRDRPDVFVAADNFIYPVQGNPNIRQAPDVYVAFGRPKGDRPSYKVWEEENIFPQVIFEIWSPNNREGEMARKRAFYRRYGAEEYYVYDPDTRVLEVWLRDNGNDFREVMEVQNFVSPRMGVRFELREGEDLRMYHPDGQPFLSVAELWQLRHQLSSALEAERQRAEAAERKLQRLQQLLQARGITWEDNS